MEHNDQALVILTWLSAGERDDQGDFTEDSRTRLVCDRLLELAESRKTYAKEGEHDAADP